MVLSLIVLTAKWTEMKATAKLAAPIWARNKEKVIRHRQLISTQAARGVSHTPSSSFVLLREQKGHSQ